MMSEFNLSCSKNFIKLALITVAAISSTLGLRTELTIILGDIAIATWVSIVWVVIIISVLAYYKAKLDVELEVFREHERNRHMLGALPIGTNNAIYSKVNKEFKKGDPVFLKEAE